MKKQRGKKWKSVGTAVYEGNKFVFCCTTFDYADDAANEINAALAAEHENLMKLERDWHKVINEILKFNPIPARDRADDQLEPPWEVIARIRKELTAERKRAEDHARGEKEYCEAFDRVSKQFAVERESKKERK